MAQQVKPNMFEELLHDLHKVVITERDIEIFQFLNEQKFMTSGQIYQTFWPETESNSGTARQRLTKLVDAGYVKTLDIQRDKKAKLKLFLLTNKGIELLKSRKLDHGFSEICKEVNHYTVEHSLKLATLRSIFRTMGQTNWKSERLIRKTDYDRGFFPDAILNVRGQKIAIELENSFREKERYVVRFHKYARANDFALVIYILSWPMVKEWLLDIEAPQDKICFLLYNDLMAKKGDAELTNKTSSIPLKAITG